MINLQKILMILIIKIGLIYSWIIKINKKILKIKLVVKPEKIIILLFQINK